MPLLTMPLFVSPADVILRMQLSEDLTGINEVISSGIISAQLHVERIIDGKLARQSQNCGYFIDAEAFSGIAPGGLYRLEIPSGLVREDVVPVITSAPGQVYGPFTNSYSNVDPTLMKMDNRKGYLYLDAATYANNYVKVQCDTGLEDGTRPLPVDGLDQWNAGVTYTVGELVQYGGKAYECFIEAPVGAVPTNATFWKLAYVPMEPLPPAIYEAIMSLVPMVFNSQQTTNRSAEAKGQYQTLTDHANLLLQPYVRTSGFTFRSI